MFSVRFDMRVMIRALTPRNFSHAYSGNNPSIRVPFSGKFLVRTRGAYYLHIPDPSPAVQHP